MLSNANARCSLLSALLMSLALTAWGQQSGQISGEGLDEGDGWTAPWGERLDC